MCMHHDHEFDQEFLDNFCSDPFVAKHSAQEQPAQASKFPLQGAVQAKRASASIQAGSGTSRDRAETRLLTLYRSGCCILSATMEYWQPVGELAPVGLICPCLGSQTARLTWDLLLEPRAYVLYLTLSTVAQGGGTEDVFEVCNAQQELSDRSDLPQELPVLVRRSLIGCAPDFF